MTSTKFLSPRAHKHTARKLTNRLESFKGITLGLLHNSKPNASFLLEVVADCLKERVRLSDVVRASKPFPSSPAPDHVYRLLAERCGAVIFASAD